MSVLKLEGVDPSTLFLLPNCLYVITVWSTWKFLITPNTSAGIGSNGVINVVPSVTYILGTGITILLKPNPYSDNCNCSSDGSVTKFLFKSNLPNPGHQTVLSVTAAAFSWGVSKPRYVLGPDNRHSTRRPQNDHSPPSRSSLPSASKHSWTRDIHVPNKLWLFLTS